VAALAVAGAVLVQLLSPGHAVYHAGWYNVLIAALIVVACIAGRRLARAGSAPRRLSIALVLAGTGIVGFAGLASGLLGADNETFVGAPGERVRVASLGVLVFPTAVSDGRGSAVRLERPLHAPLQVGTRSRDAGDFVLRAQPRPVVYVQARDASGNRLTITQPQGTAFLSPVLLMQHQQPLAGLNLPYDSFNLPAARRIVKAVMFSPAQAALLLHGGAEPGEPAVLFAVDDENERPLPHAIALSAAGRAVRVAGLTLQGDVTTYPAVEVIAVPNLLGTAFGTLLVLGGLIALIVS